MGARVALLLIALFGGAGMLHQWLMSGQAIHSMMEVYLFIAAAGFFYVLNLGVLALIRIVRSLDRLERLVAASRRRDD
jgi:hypothetical protein